MEEAVIVSAKRTPIGDFCGMLKDYSAVELGTAALKGAISAGGIEAGLIEEVIGGQVYQAGCKGNTARQIALAADCSDETVALTINQQCPSSLRAVEMMAQNIMLGKMEVGAVVGYESMTNVPHLIQGARSGYKLGGGKIVDGLLHDALIDAFNGYHMGITAENLAQEYDISREEQDAFALQSHERACQAASAGRFTDEIIPLEIKTKKGIEQAVKDEHPNPETSLERLAELKPAFKSDGTVTAGNASSLNDGAAAVIVMSKTKAEQLGLQPMAKITASASAAVNPKVMGIGVVPAVEKVLKLAGVGQEAIDNWEINEAFAAQFLAVNRELKLNLDKVNVHGSGISLGHPVGCTGVRLLVSLLTVMEHRQLKRGCATLCAGGGPAAAMIVERF
ncbi:acetyl-CoA C-acyltransferase [Sediminibacillus dalangtanensis]|uniref:acetyl-CoA C-acetyltransferase n=1 Tax=Sediminibacillus dalangtanensis TaxID=2729421 RepID=A0ABX7VY07_9BACI|nr:thiolase family protein [Sediminibacillus dalangtanensis]QTN00531.1 acetyl-CoA C-acyltransferase [Sediminibacillus dalangtanensis]